jgi:hypothetical protein
MTRNTLNLQNVKFVDDNTALTSGTSIDAPANEVMAKAQKELDDWQACSNPEPCQNSHMDLGTCVEQRPLANEV